MFLGAFRIAIWPEEDGSIRELLRTYRLCLALMREVLGREAGRMVQDSTQQTQLNASRDRGQYDCYITAIEIGNNRKFNKLHP